MKWKKCISAGLSLMMAVSALAAAAPRARAAEERPAEPGLWITEIYQNDVKRTDTFGNSSDQMEFVEVINTADRSVELGRDYTLWYEYPSGESYVMKELTVSAPDGSAVVSPGETVILWNQRTDLGGEEGGSYASEAQFRQAMRVPEGVRVYRVSGQAGFTENDRGFALKNSAGEVTSYYHYNSTPDAVTADGLAVSLQIPDFGSCMQVYEAKKPATAGLVYAGQCNGQRPVSAPESLAPQGVFITEIRPNDSNRDSQFGSGSNDLMECLEVYNTTDRPVDLNEEYELVYRLKETSSKPLPLYRLTDSGKLNPENCVVPAGSAAVLWCYRAEALVGSYDRYPTEEEFREAYSIDGGVPVYVFTAQNGLGNTLRGLELYRKEAGGGKTLLSGYFWDGVTDLKDNRSVELRVNPEGPQMLVYRSQVAANMGKVSAAQVTFPADDGSSPVLTLLDDRTSVQQGQFLRIPYQFSGTAVMPVQSITLYYRTSQMERYTSVKTTSFAIYNKWYAFIPSDVLLHGTYVDYYVKATNAYRTAVTPVRRVQVNHLDDGQTGLRVNFPAEEAVSGQVTVTAKDFSGAVPVYTAQVDGEALSLHPSLELGAFFTFSYRGVDSYFKNGLVCGGQIIKNFSKCNEIPTDSSMAIFVDQGYFTVQEDGSSRIQLEIWPGTYGSTWENDTDANNDDFYISRMALSLTDGTELHPIAITNEYGTALSLTEELKVGDSTDCNKKVIMTFEVPANKVDGAAGTLDAASMEEGAHTLVVCTSTGEAKTIHFTVDHTKPLPDPEPTPVNVNMGLQVSAYPAVATVEAPETAATVEVRQAVCLPEYAVSTGLGDSTFSQTAAETLQTVVSENGQLPYEVFTVDTKGQTAGNLRLDVTAQASYGQPVRLYALTQADTWQPLEISEENGVVTAIASMEGLVSEGKITILAQARGAEYQPVTAQPATADTAANDYVWDGTGIPEQYDFAFAWITDTQYYSEQYVENFDAVTDWIVEQKDRLGISYVIHTGDIVDEFNETYQFENASQELEKLEAAGVPYGVLGGNHDVAHGNANYELYDKYFGAFRYEGNPWYGGTYNDNKGHYDLVQVDGEKLLLIYMSWDIYTPEVEWINSVLEQYPDRKAILCTHPGINAKAVPDYFSDLLVEQVCRDHPNVIAMLNGHYHGASLNFLGFDDDGDGVEERVVYRICTDYQSAPGGGQGYVKMIYFDLANNKVYLNSYSPVLDDFNYYDTPKLDSYGIGTVASDIDIAELAVAFDRQTPKTLEVTGFRASILLDTLVAQAEAHGSVELPLGQTAGEVYAVARNQTGAIVAYSGVQTVNGPAEYTVSAQTSEGGSLTPEGVTSVIQGGSITYTIIADAGYEIAGVWVDGQSVGAVETYTFENISEDHTIEAVFRQTEPAPQELPFVDVDDTDWFYEDVAYTFRQGLLKGMDGAHFQPQTPVTRGMAATVLYRLAGCPEAPEAGFVDVDPAKYYGTAVAWTRANGLVKGYEDGTFRPDQPITRQELVAMLYRYAAFRGKDVSARASLDGFTDQSWLQPYAREAMSWAVAVGLVQGITATSLAPKDATPRCQLATLLHRLSQSM